MLIPETCGSHAEPVALPANHRKLIAHRSQSVRGLATIRNSGHLSTAPPLQRPISDRRPGSNRHSLVRLVAANAYTYVMKRLISVCAVALMLFPATAVAKKKGPPVYVPPNQSAASQYTEDVPTAGGATPSSSVHHTITPGSGSGGSNGGGSAGSGSSGSGAASSGSTISGSTLSAMTKNGSTGTAAASVAEALAPKSSSTKAHASSTGKAAKRSTRTKLSNSPPVTEARGSSPAGQVIKTLAGSDAGSGVGVLLPIILIGSLVLATVLGVARFLRLGASSP
jgi:predicted small lipoprotein YifL